MKHRMREDQRAVFEFGAKLFRLRGEMGERALLTSALDEELPLYPQSPTHCGIFDETVAASSVILTRFRDFLAMKLI